MEHPFLCNTRVLRTRVPRYGFSMLRLNLDAETEVLDPFLVQAVLLQQLRTAGIGADAGILIIDTDDGILFYQLIGVHRTHQLQSTVMGNVALEAGIGTEFQTISHLQQFNFCVVTMLLGHDIRNILLLSSTFKEADPGMILHITIVFTITSAKVHKLVIVIWCFKLKTKSWQPYTVFTNISV